MKSNRSGQLNHVQLPVEKISYRAEFFHQIGVCISQGTNSDLLALWSIYLDSLFIEEVLLIHERVVISVDCLGAR